MMKSLVAADLKCARTLQATSLPEHHRRQPQRTAGRRRKASVSRAAASEKPDIASQPSTPPQPDVLFWMQSPHNDVRVLAFPDDPNIFGPLAGCTALMLGRSNNIHSISNVNAYAAFSQFYWYHLALVAGLAEDGPIGILGLGAGTIAKTINHHWPDRQIHGWEIDGLVVEAGRQHMGMQELEDSGVLVTHIGDALAQEASIEGGFAGLVVDLYVDDGILGKLYEESTWRDIRNKLRPGGVLITNLLYGPASEAFLKAFSGEEVFVKFLQGNFLAVAGADPGKAQAIPAGMQTAASEWQAAF